MQGVEFVKLVRYRSTDNLTIDYSMAEAQGKKEKDKDFLVQCSQHFPSESEAAHNYTPQNYTCSTLTSGGSRKPQAVSNKYRSG
jgi:hypothetical protein